MTKQEEIRHGIAARLEIAYNIGISKKPCDTNRMAESAVEQLASQGVVIQVERELPASICGYCENLDTCLEEHSECDKFRLSDVYVAVIPLKEEV